ncbi:hypothetical protein [Bacillus subtilis]|uniref:hypothetical protein n=1 Tax=Bacillus subtilis TaxID=1423 RepID=UPI003F83A606
MKYLSKTDIIEKVTFLPERHDKREISERAWLDRLNASIEVLKDDVILNRKKINDVDYYFFANQVNLDAKIVTSPRETHYFDQVTATILIAFLALYEHPFTKDYINGKLIDKKTTLQWFEEIEKITAKIVKDIFREEPSKIDYWSINIISQFSKLARREPFLSSISKRIDKRIIKITSKMLALDDEDKTLLYQEKVERLFDRIEKEIDNTVGKYNPTEKELYDFDMDLYLQKDKGIEMISQIYSKSEDS